MAELLQVKISKNGTRLISVEIMWADGSPFLTFLRKIQHNTLSVDTFQYPLDHVKELLSAILKSTINSSNPFYLDGKWVDGGFLRHHDIVRINHQRFMVIRSWLISLEKEEMQEIDVKNRYEVVGSIEEKELTLTEYMQ